MKYFNFLAALLFSLYSSAQVFTWNKVVDSTNQRNNLSNNINSITKKTTDNYIVYLQNSIESYNSLGQIKYDSIIISKYTLDGNVVWQKKYPLQNGGRINDFTETVGHGLLLVGEIGIYNSIVKLDVNGNFEFAKNYINTDSLLSIKKIVATNDGNYMLASYKDIIINSCFMFYQISVKEQSFITKISPDGNIIWHQFFSENEFRKGTENGPYTQSNISGIRFDFLKDSEQTFNILYHTKVNFDSTETNLHLLHLDKNGNRIDSVLLKKYHIYTNPWVCFADNSNDYLKITTNGYTLYQPTSDSSTTLLKKYYYDKLGNIIDSTIIDKPSIYFTGNNLLYNTNNYTYTIQDDALQLVSLIISGGILNNRAAFSYLKCDTDFIADLNVIDLNDETIFVGTCNFLHSINDSTLLFISNTKKSIQDSLTYLKFYHISLNSNHIEYSIYIDRNNNGILDNLDTSYTKCLIELDNGSSIQTLQPISTTNTIEANYSKYLLAGNYTSKLISYDQTLRYYTVTPLTKTSVFSTNYNGVDSLGFRLTPKPNIQDLQLNIIPITNARPGFNTYYKITAKNVGTKTAGNISVQFIKDHLQSVDSTYYTQPYSIIDDTIIWQIDSLKIFEEQSFYVVCNNATPPNLNIGDTLHLLAKILPIENDSFIQDNVAKLHQPIVNAVDPNDKVETHGGTISFSDIQHQEYLYYTIRFQNTGSSYASRVVITDTLTNNLDPTTLEMLSFSHTFTYNVIDRKYITWTANNMYLPDSTTNETESHGYISFRIKPKANLSHTDVITNRASIIFDYNEAISTNTCTTNIIEERISGIQQNNIKSIKLFPSPTSGNVQLSFDASFNQNLTVKIMNLQGNVIYQQDIKNQLGINAIELQLSEFANGIYFIQLNADNNNLYYGKVLKQ